MAMLTACILIYSNVDILPKSIAYTHKIIQNLSSKVFKSWYNH